MSNHEQKQWWAPVWKGLVMDADAKHYRKMKNAVWLYLYLLVNANRATGVLMRKIKTIDADMGITRDTTMRWLGILRKEGYIATVNTGRYLTIQVKNWKPVSKYKHTQQQKTDCANSSGWKDPTPAQARVPPESVHWKPETGIYVPANNRNINIVLNNETQIMQHAIRHGPDNRGFTSIGLCARQEFLALDLAEALNDLDGIGRYRCYCRKYPEELLRTVLSEVNKTPAIRIKKSRAALFNYLLQHYAKRTTENPGG